MTRRRRFWSFGVAVLATGAWLMLSPRPVVADDMTVYKSPSCGCCIAWVNHLRANGFSVTVKESENMTPIKSHLGVPRHLRSCHTATVDGYTIEGHVPAADIKRLLSERPKGRGLAVPGMPVGSPGMEMGGRRDAYDVFLFDRDSRSVFARH